PGGHPRPVSCAHFAARHAWFSSSCRRRSVDEVARRAGHGERAHPSGPAGDRRLVGPTAVLLRRLARAPGALAAADPMAGTTPARNGRGHPALLLSLAGPAAGAVRARGPPLPAARCRGRSVSHQAAPPGARCGRSIPADRLVRGCPVPLLWWRTVRPPA